MPNYPGWGLPHDHERPRDVRYEYSTDGTVAYNRMIPVREVAMMNIIERFSDRENWHKMIYNEAHLSQWRREMLAIPDVEFRNLVYEGTGQHDREPMCKLTGIINDAVLDFCVEELRVKAKYFEKSGIVPVLDSWVAAAKSDTLVPKHLHDALYSAFHELEMDQNTLEKQADSDDPVKDLVDPSMYPLVYGRSRGFQEECVGLANAIDHWSGKGNVVPKYNIKAPELMDDENTYWSANYQWLPANVQFGEDGRVHFASYINNLHPAKCRDAYIAMEKLVAAMIPLWDQCLNIGNGPRFNTPDGPQDENDDNWIPKDKAECANIDVTEKDLQEAMWDEEDFNLGLLEELEEGHGFNYGRDEDDVPYHPDFITHCKWMVLRKADIPEPHFSSDRDFDFTIDEEKRIVNRFRKPGLQVIVKVTSIHLTPENPELEVGEWQLAGQANERICASAIYCLDNQNISTPTLSFRVQTNDEGGVLDPYGLTHSDFYIAQGEGYGWLRQIYGNDIFGGSCVQSYGHVKMTTGRLLAFPNTFQTLTSPIKLVDTTKPGYQRFIVVYLVEPSNRIISTANIPPQQMHWYSDSVLGATTKARKAALSKIPPEVVTILSDPKVEVEEADIEGKLPVELMEMVIEHAKAEKELPMDVEEAQDHRAKLMQERRDFLEKVNEEWRMREYECVEA